MKRACLLFFLLIFTFGCISPVSAYAEEDADYMGEITGELENILDDYNLGFEIDDIKEISFGELVGEIKNSLVSHIKAPLKILSTIFLVVVFSTLIKSTGGVATSKNSADIYNMVCVMTAVAVIVPQLLAVYSETLGAMRTGGNFILVFVPVFTAVSVACGGFTSAGVYHVMMLGASEFIIKISESYMLPILSVISALSVAGSVFPNTSLESVSNLLKKAITWGISITMTLFTGFVSLKCTITGKTDGVATKTAKMLMSGFIPIVGGAVSDAYSTVKGSFEVIGGTVGTVGIIAVVLIMLPEIIKIFIYRVVMWTGSAAADIFSADSISKLLKGIDSGLAIAQSVIICHCLIFVLCSAILMQTL